MNLILCGMPFSGKTTLGKKLAARLDWTFVDTDRLIEKEAGNSCREIYIKEGEVAFRILESHVIASLKGCRHHVIALGGGAMEREENRTLLKDLGLIIYLKASSQLLLDRMKGKLLPAYLDPQAPELSLERLAAKRCPIFQQLCDLIVAEE